MKTQAAILVETGKPLHLTELDIPRLKPGQVLVEIVYSSICHTQLLESRGHRGEDKYLPHALGHEGSGIVREIGPEVTKVKPGDHVILSWIKGSGKEISQTVYPWENKTVNSGAIATFMHVAVVSENRLTVIDEKIPMQEAAFLGCAVATGVGAVTHTAHAQSGQSLAVFGVGGVGLCAVAGAAAIGCNPIIAVDVTKEKLEFAKQMGATHAFHSNDIATELSRLCPNGLDVAIEASGKPEVMRQALQSVRGQGGTAVVIGNARHGETVSIDPRQLNLGKRLLGTWGGDTTPDVDFPYYCKLLSSGKLRLKPLLAKSYRLSEINNALNDLENGKVVRPLIEMHHAN